jgi:hypothetical protein
VAIQQVQGTVQGPSQSANSCPCCTFRASFPAFCKSAIGGAYGIETTGSCQKAAFFLLESRRIEPPSHASPLKLALPKGRQLHNGLRDVGVARPSSSRRQHTCRFPPLLLRFSRIIRLFWLAQPGRAQLVRARACRGQNSNFEKILCQNVKRCLEALWRFCASKSPIFKKPVGTFLG